MTEQAVMPPTYSGWTLTFHATHGRYRGRKSSGPVAREGRTAAGASPVQGRKSGRICRKYSEKPGNEPYALRTY